MKTILFFCWLVVGGAIWYVGFSFYPTATTWIAVAIGAALGGWGINSRMGAGNEKNNP